MKNLPKATQTGCSLCWATCLSYWSICKFIRTPCPPYWAIRSSNRTKSSRFRAICSRSWTKCLLNWAVCSLNRARCSPTWASCPPGWTRCSPARATCSPSWVTAVSGTIARPLIEKHPIPGPNMTLTNRCTTKRSPLWAARSFNPNFLILTFAMPANLLTF